MTISNSLDVRIRETDTARGVYHVSKDLEAQIMHMVHRCSRCGIATNKVPVDIGFGTKGRVYLYCPACVANGNNAT